MSVKHITRWAVAVIFILVMAVTIAIILLASDSDDRTDKFWISCGFLLFSELLLGISIIHIAGSKTKDMPFKAGQIVVTVIYFFITLSLTMTVGRFLSIKNHIIVQLIMMLFVSTCIILFAVAQFARRNSDNLAIINAESKSKFCKLLSDFIEDIRLMPSQDKMSLALSELYRIADNAQYGAESISGSESIDNAIFEQIGKLKEISKNFSQTSDSVLQDESHLFQQNTQKLKYLLEQRELTIKQLR